MSTSPSGGFWSVQAAPVDDDFWGPQELPAAEWTVVVPPVDNGYWTPRVGKYLDINFILDESRLS